MCGASPYDEKAVADVKAQNLKEELKDIPLFYGRGAWDEEAMSLPDRMLCRMLQKAVAKKRPEHLRTVDEGTDVRSGTEVRLDG